MCKCPGSGIRRAWRSHKRGRALGAVEGGREGEELRERCGTAGRKPSCNYGHALHKHQEPAGSGEVYTVCTGKQPHGGDGDGTRPSPPSCRARRCHVDLVSLEPQHSGTARRCRIPPGCPAEDVPARWACRKDGEGSPVPPRAGPAPWWRGAGTRCHPLAAPRRLQLPVPTPAPRRGIKERSSSRKSSLLGQRNFK